MSGCNTSASELAADLAFMETLRVMKARFQSSILTAARTEDVSVLASLRQESLYQLAEFLFALRGYGIDDARKLEQLASLHNDHLLAIRADRERMQRFGLTVERLEAALFTGDVLRKMVANYANGSSSIDQSDLARFLVTVMSTETCRKLVLACERAGFLERTRSPYGAVLVRSAGILEEIYGSTLREARSAATSQPCSSPCLDGHGLDGRRPCRPCRGAGAPAAAQRLRARGAGHQSRPRCAG